MTKHTPIKDKPQAHDMPIKEKADAKTEAPKNIYQRLAEAMLEVSYVQKQKPTKDGLKYSVVTHDAVTSKCRPALLKAGIVYHPVSMSVAQNGNRTEVQMIVRFVNIHDPKDYIETPSIGYGIDTQDKGPGKATSYAVKYALLKTLGLETGDDADLESIEHKADTPAAKAPPKNHASEGIKQAWEDAVKDSLPQGATPLQTAEAYAAAIIEDLTKMKRIESLDAHWQMRLNYITLLQGKEEYSALYGDVVDAYETTKNAIEEKAAK